MSETRTVESTGASIEEAIYAGLRELQVSRENVIVEILEEPSRGILGMGAKQARVKLTTAVRPRQQELEDARKITPNPVAIDYPDEEEEDFFIPSEVRTVPDEEMTQDAIIGREKLEDLLRMMDVEATVDVEASAADTAEERTLVLQIQGDDLSMLIGKKGETLAALQYITRLVASRELHRRANFIIDAGGYKAKRTETLRKLAERMANQAVERGRTVKLEPMPPHERRVIHMALRHRRDVTTRSVGEGQTRKVTIIPENE